MELSVAWFRKLRSTWFLIIVSACACINLTRLTVLAVGITAFDVYRLHTRPGEREP